MRRRSEESPKSKKSGALYIPILNYSRIMNSGPTLKAQYSGSTAGREPSTQHDNNNNNNPAPRRGLGLPRGRLTSKGLRSKSCHHLVPRPSYLFELFVRIWFANLVAAKSSKRTPYLWRRLRIYLCDNPSSLQRHGLRGVTPKGMVQSLNKQPAGLDPACISAAGEAPKRRRQSHPLKAKLGGEGAGGRMRLSTFAA